MMIKYVEANRTVEAQSECILFLYLVDVNGTPAPSVKIKIWAGPPPSGRPPYYEDEDSNNPARRTDSTGKFQFIVAKPTPTQALDFFVQAVDDIGSVLSEPIHFPFPPHEARWVSVTLAAVAAAPEEASAPPTKPEAEPVQRVPANAGLTTQLGSDPVGAGTTVAATNRVSCEPAPKPKPQPRPKIFPHYLLFGPGQQIGTLTNLIIALDYIIRFTPVVGFSPEEAKNADHVTMVGDNNLLSPAVEQALREAGCKVTRLTASDSYALEHVFKQLIDSGSPFPSS